MTNQNPTQPPVPPQQGGQVPPAPSGGSAQGVPQRPATPAQPGQRPSVPHGASQGHIPTAQHPTMPMPQQGMPGQAPQQQYSVPQQQFPGQPYQAQHPHPLNQQLTSSQSRDGKSFFAKLFDLKFNEKLTLSGAGIIFVIGLFLILVNSIVGVVIGSGLINLSDYIDDFNRGLFKVIPTDAMGYLEFLSNVSGVIGTVGIAVVIISIVAGIFLACMLRICIEMIIANVQTAENTYKLVKKS